MDFCSEAKRPLPAQHCLPTFNKQALYGLLQIFLKFTGARLSRGAGRPEFHPISQDFLGAAHPL